MEELESPPSQLAPDPTVQDVPSFDVPSLLFENGTPFSAMQFDTIDQHDAPFHVIVAKMGYSIGPCGDNGLAPLIVLDEPVELNTQDIYVEEEPCASVLEESDLAPHKPRCDVIVNASGFAPGGKPVRSFTARLSVDKKHGVTQQAFNVIDKTLSICGQRWFIKKNAVRRLAEMSVAIGTAGLIRPSPWRLSAAQPLVHLPIRYEYAVGGECRVNSDSPAAKRVAKKHRFQDGQSSERPIAVAHEVCETNPLGKGFARSWFLSAERCKRLPAPQITEPSRECNSRQFVRSASGHALPPPAGFGVIGRAWLPRRALIGKIEEKVAWAPDEVPRLPANFDYAYWNCAPTDQQCDYLDSPAQFALMNLCSSGNPSGKSDQQGNTSLRFELPLQAMTVLAQTHNAEVTVLPLSLDTVVITPESNRLDLVWRGHLEADHTYASARLLHLKDLEQIQRMHELALANRTSDIDDKKDA